MPARIRRSGSEVGLREDRLERRGRGPPRSRTCRPCRVTGATGNTTSAARVTSVSRSSRRDHERRGLERGAGGRPGRRCRRGRRHRRRRPPSSPATAAATIASASRPAASGRRSTPQRGGGVDAGRGVGDRAAAGQQVRQAAGLDRAAVTGPTRHPGEPGAGLARPARPRRCSAPGDGRQPLADQDHRGLVDAVLGLLDERRRSRRPRRRGRCGPACRSSWPGRGW